MPLNLLQHKSWHVGSAKNQERVRRDEKEARLREEEEERRMQLADADHRLKILRQRMSGAQDGDVSLQVDHDEVAAIAAGATITTTSTGADTRAGSTEWGRRDRGKKRRREDDDEMPPRGATSTSTSTMKHKSSNVPLTGPDGHINLFPPEAIQKTDPKSHNKDYMADKKRKEDELEAQYTMKLSRPSEPWYSTVDKVSEADKAKDEGRKRREERVETRARDEHDPLKAMKFGLEKLREVREEAATERRRRDADVGIGVGFGLERQRQSSTDIHRDRHEDKDRHSHGRKDRDRDRDRRKDGKRHGAERHKDEKHKDEKHKDKKHKDERDEDRERSKDRERRKDRERQERNGRKISDRDRSSRHRDGGERGDRDALAQLREERQIREAAEQRKARALVEDELSFRKPEKWTASAAGGKGRYSSQFSSS